MSELVPKLRFSEFNGSSFSKISLNEATHYFKGLAFKSDDYQTTGHIKHRIIRVSDLSSDSIKNDNSMIYYPESKAKNVEKYRVKAEDIIVTTVGSRPELKESAVGRGIFIDTDNNGFLNQNLLILRTTKDNISKFIASQINTNRYIDYIKSIQRGNANQANITVHDLLDYQIAVTSLKEQQKIADFLTSVDTKISQLTEKHRLLKEYKKGVMQQIFSQKIRFKDENGEDFPEWEELQLRDIFEVCYGKDFKHLNEGTIPVLGTGGIMTFVDTYLYDQPSVLIGRKGTIDKPQFITVPFWTVDTLFYTKIKQGYNPKFVFYICQMINWKKYNEATGVPSLNTTSINRIKVSIPNLIEQEKVVDLFESIDQKIDAVAEQIEQSKQFKKGLLQQMFV